MAEKLAGNGSTLSYATQAAPSSFTVLTDVRLITPPNMKKGKSKSTVLTSASNTHEYLSTWIDTGEIPFEIAHTDANVAALLTIFQAIGLPGNYQWKIILPKTIAQVSAGANIVFAGSLTEVGWTDLTTDENGVIWIKCKVSLSGPITYTAGS